MCRGEAIISSTRCTHTCTMSPDREADNCCRDIVPHPDFPGVRTLPVAMSVNWNSLPLDLVEHAALMLNWRDVCTLASVNKACRNVANSQKLWELQFRRRFGRPNPDRTPACWKHLFRLSHEAFTEIIFGVQPEAPGIRNLQDVAINFPVQA